MLLRLLLILFQLTDIFLGRLEKGTANLDPFELLHRFFNLTEFGVAYTKVQTGFIAEYTLIKTESIVVMFTRPHIQNAAEKIYGFRILSLFVMPTGRPPSQRRTGWEPAGSGFRRNCTGQGEVCWRVAQRVFQ